MLDNLPIVDDDFLSLDDVENYKKYFLSHPSKVRWVFMPKTSIELSNQKYSEKIFSRIYESHSFSHFLLWDKDPYLNAPGSEQAMEILNKFGSKHGIEVEKIIRAKVNLSSRSDSSAQFKFYTPHVDIDIQHFGFIYYLNDSDGDTVFFNKTHPEQKMSESDTEEILRVSPKAGRAVLFNGLQYHAGSPCVDSDYRALINIDFQ
jgi:hypothetical protein